MRVYTAQAMQGGTAYNVGKPIANTQIYIVDRYMQPVPLGVTGELCIAGEGVGTGEYLNRLGFVWSELGIGYLRKYFKYLKEIGYLQGGEEYV